jgi:hypothetical protein
VDFARSFDKLELPRSGAAKIKRRLAPEILDEESRVPRLRRFEPAVL